MSFRRPIIQESDRPGGGQGRLVTLAFLAAQLPTSLLAGRIASTLAAETGESVALGWVVATGEGITTGGGPGDFIMEDAALPQPATRGATSFSQFRVGVPGACN